MAKSTLRRTPHVLSALALWMGLASCLAQTSSPASKRVLDLTAEPPRRSNRSFGVPGGEGGGVSGGSPDRRYSVPLQITIVAVRSPVVNGDNMLLVEALMRNSASTPIHLPASKDRELTFQPGNRGRRTSLYFIRFLKPDSPLNDESIIGAADGSITSPESLLRVNPGEEVLVRLKGDYYQLLSPVRGLIEKGVAQFTVRLVYLEYTLKDDQYSVLERAKPVESENTFTIPVR